MTVLEPLTVAIPGDVPEFGSHFVLATSMSTSKHHSVILNDLPRLSLLPRMSGVRSRLQLQPKQPRHPVRRYSHLRQLLSSWWLSTSILSSEIS